MAVMQPVEVGEGQNGSPEVGGRIVEFGPSEAIYADPKEAYTRKLIEATPKDDIEAIRERVERRKATRGG
ncbi:MAG: hypothetical protein AAGG46_06335, partial [Planctomycetota bacterium]